MPRNTIRSLQAKRPDGPSGQGEAAPSTEAKPKARPSLRERNKLHKEEAIRGAARRLFLESGYEATTLREVAEAADVGFGTVFAYAADKAGLLAMVFVEELSGLPALFPQERDDQDPLDGLIAGLEELYQFWARIPGLSQHVLQQMEFYSGNPHVEAIIARRSQSKRELAEWIVRLQAKGKLSSAFDPHESAETLFAIYTSAVREWSATAAHDATAGLTRLRALMKLPIWALTNAAATPKPASATRKPVRKKPDGEPRPRRDP